MNCTNISVAHKIFEKSKNYQALDIRKRAVNRYLVTVVFQIMQTRKDALEGKSLPADFRLSPTRGHSGMRSPWGGEIGGVKASYLVSAASPLPYSAAEDQPFTRLLSAGNTESTESTMADIR